MGDVQHRMVGPLLVCSIACAHPVPPPQNQARATAPPEAAVVQQPEEPPDEAVRTSPTPAAVPTPRLGLKVSPPDASLEINGVDLGPATGEAARRALGELAPGIHRLVLRRDGYEKWRAEVRVEPAPQTLEVTLAPVDSSTP